MPLFLPHLYLWGAVMSGFRLGLSFFLYILSLCSHASYADHSHIYNSSRHLSLKIQTPTSRFPFKPSPWMSDRDLESHTCNNTSRRDFLTFLPQTCPLSSPPHLHSWTCHPAGQTWYLGAILDSAFSHLKRPNRQEIWSAPPSTSDRP